MSISIQPGRPATQEHSYDEPRVYVVHDQGLADFNIVERGRKLELHGTWTLRQYRNPVPCGAHFALHPGPGATYEWKVTE